LSSSLRRSSNRPSMSLLSVTTRILVQVEER
jgi:hypothetical protein